MHEFTFRVEGDPKPKGSYRQVVNNGKPVFIPMSKGEPVWRRQVDAAATREWEKQYDADQILTAVSVDITFLMRKPKSAKRRYPTVVPDLDKLIRSTLDAMQDAGVYKNDAQVIKLDCRKLYAEPEVEPGAVVKVRWEDDENETEFLV